MLLLKKADTFYFLARQVLLSLLSVYSITGTAQPPELVFLRGDEQVLFNWRFGYSEFPFPSGSPAAQEDAGRGIYGWYDGTLWSQAYKSWDSSITHGVQLLFRGGSPYARQVKCISSIVPYSKAGEPVSFLIPYMYTIGSEENISFALTVKGKTEETLVCKLQPKAQAAFTGGMIKANFITLKLSEPTGTKPIITAIGLLHVRVYPTLLNYGDRMEFIFSSTTQHMDVESSLVLGSIFNHQPLPSPYPLQNNYQPADIFFREARQHHAQKLENWRKTTAALSQQLQQKATIEVFCSGPGMPRNRGELRVMAYSGNPVKDFQYGAPAQQIPEIAAAVTKALGRRFSLFRYQHHYLPWRAEDPSTLDSTQIPYLEQWLTTANNFADTVMLDFQLSPVIKLYKQYSKMGQSALPPEGIPGAEWSKITQGYITALRFARQVCPNLKIVQMPYELDNIAHTEVHSDAHYRFYKCLYKAVAVLNKELPAGQQLLVAGLGANNANSRWDFIEGFLRRYSQDHDPDKQLDYITWHTYLFPGNYPSMMKGVNDSLQKLLTKYKSDQKLKVIVDEMGLAEPSTIEDLSDLSGAMKKEAAMASYSAILQDYYEKEKGPFIPISGAGWHFALLTYGQQNILSAYTKGMVLRNRLGDMKIPVKAGPQDDQGFGLHAVATKTDQKISILVSAAAPSIFYEQAAPLEYKTINISLKKLPVSFQKKKLRVTQWYSTPNDPVFTGILSQDKYQTLPLTRGADRYTKNFSLAEAATLNQINKTSTVITASSKDDLSLTVNLDAYGMKLIEIEADTGK
ncbi:hypothetical protein [Niabella drilacis]|uniref:Uncharacterized protein n=1 Tax=Niabella drilacis (strain DSM 25811 / CCM 8410 / CCUG 62505 / LMG 26954 / E90) TaxID=1285928 RepID=A0A1G6XIZ2_NIADE|nr:hypothetical protein [Niabella drilacis]SDD78214.1 hypothetical protein SAMN04487894_11396 [Niabella drilacis]